MDRGPRACRSRRSRAGACRSAGPRDGAARARSHHDGADAHWRYAECRGDTALSSLAGCGRCAPPRSSRCRRCRRRSRPSWQRCSATADFDVRLLATELARNMKASEATRLLCDLIDARTAPQCLRRSGRRADGGRDAGGHSHAGKMCGAICTNAVPAVRHLSGDRPHIGRGRLAEMAGPDDAESRSVHITPEEVQRFCEFLYRRTGMSFTKASDISSTAASRTASRRPAPQRSRRIFPCCVPMPTMRSSI